MASAASDASLSPLSQQEETEGPQKEGPTDLFDDEEDDIAPRSKRKPAATVPTFDPEDSDRGELRDKEEEADNDLFGDDDGDDRAETGKRQLGDSELDSGDDEDRRDRAPDGEDASEDGVDQTMEEISMLPVELPRQQYPKSDDGELYLLKMPSFAGIDPTLFNASTFQPPKTDHHSKAGPSIDFSARRTARTTVRHRLCSNSSDNSKNGSNGVNKRHRLRSNARIIRWSNGSLTLQIGSDPKTIYSLLGHGLAPPQNNPPKPTPTSINPNDESRKYRRNPSAETESYTYLAAPITQAQVLRITNKITCGLSVEASRDNASDAIARLQARVTAAQREKHTLGPIIMDRDPEVAKKEAELAEKEKEKAARKRMAQEMRERERQERRAFGIPGPRAGGGGLTVGGLEDEGEGGTRRVKRSAPGKSYKKARSRANRRGEILSDEEEEFGRRTRTKEDEYDEEDDFVAGSDEEEEEGAEGEDEQEADEGDGEEDEEEEADEVSPSRNASPAKRKSPIDGEADGGTSRPAGISSPLARSKRRRVVEDDDDDQ